jgi:Fe-S cluster biogenesis protein NfuA
MTTTLNAREFQGSLERLDALLRDSERSPDPAARARLQEVVRLVLELHGVALERVLDHVAAAGEAGRAVLDTCAADEVVSGLLLLHGLHPLGVEDRVRQALEGVRPYLRAHGGSVELVGVDEGVVRLRLLGSCDGCPSSSAATKQTIEQAVFARAPEVTAVEVEAGAAPVPAADGAARLALPLL